MVYESAEFQDHAWSGTRSSHGCHVDIIDGGKLEIQKW